MMATLNLSTAGVILPPLPFRPKSSSSSSKASSMCNMLLLEEEDNAADPRFRAPGVDGVAVAAEPVREPVRVSAIVTSLPPA